MADAIEQQERAQLDEKFARGGMSQADYMAALTAILGRAQGRTTEPRAVTNDVKRERAALDARFNSAENERTGALTLTAYNAQVEALEDRAHAAPSLASEPAREMTGVLMTAALHAELQAFRDQYDAALKRHDSRVMIKTVLDPRFDQLIRWSAADEARAVVAEGASLERVLAHAHAEHQITRLMLAANLVHRNAITARVVSIERELQVCLKETGAKSGIVINTTDATFQIPGLDSVSDAVASLEETLLSPVRPIFDAKTGRPIAAVRDRPRAHSKNATDQATLETLQAQVQALEKRLAKLERHGGAGAQHGRRFAFLKAGGRRWAERDD